MRTKFDGAKRRWDAEGGRDAMKRSFTNPSFSARLRRKLVAETKPVPASRSRAGLHNTSLNYARASPSYPLAQRARDENQYVGRSIAGFWFGRFHSGMASVKWISASRTRQPRRRGGKRGRAVPSLSRSFAPRS
jgi:hypothetical protein